MNETKMIDSPMSTPKKKYSASKEIKENDLTKCVRVREIENGYIVTYSKYGYADDDPKHETYIDESTEKFSKTNPFSDEKEEDEEDKLEAMVDLFNPPIK